MHDINIIILKSHFIELLYIQHYSILTIIVWLGNVLKNG